MTMTVMEKAAFDVMAKLIPRLISDDAADKVKTLVTVENIRIVANRINAFLDFIDNGLPLLQQDIMSIKESVARLEEKNNDNSGSRKRGKLPAPDGAIHVDITGGSPG